MLESASRGVNSQDLMKKWEMNRGEMSGSRETGVSMSRGGGCGREASTLLRGSQVR